jgi:hypothetical protein
MKTLESLTYASRCALGLLMLSGFLVFCVVAAGLAAFRGRPPVFGADEE